MVSQQGHDSLGRTVRVSLKRPGTYGVVKSLNPNGDGFLAVRSGPGNGNAMVDKIHNGQAIVTDGVDAPRRHLCAKIAVL